MTNLAFREDGNEMPSYPEEALREGWEGVVKLKVCFRQGEVTQVTVVESSGFMILDEAAIASARKWRLSQYSAFTMTVPVEFRIVD